VTAEKSPQHGVEAETLASAGRQHCAAWCERAHKASAAAYCGQCVPRCIAVNQNDCVQQRINVSNIFHHVLPLSLGVRGRWCGMAAWAGSAKVPVGTSHSSSSPAHSTGAHAHAYGIVQGQCTPTLQACIVADGATSAFCCMPCTITGSRRRGWLQCSSHQRESPLTCIPPHAQGLLILSAPTKKKIFGGRLICSAAPQSVAFTTTTKHRCRLPQCLRHSLGPE
jgi:hypothetical protein